VSTFLLITVASAGPAPTYFTHLHKAFSPELSTKTLAIDASSDAVTRFVGHR
jgi:hypothetical protein